MAAMTRSGFVALAGRPNVGKSTLVNAMVGHKVAIVSDKPQTTRRAIRGVVTAGDFQLVLTDLPGVQRPRDALTARMQRRVETELAEADAALFVVNGDQGVGGAGDRFIAEALGKALGAGRDRGQQGRPAQPHAHRPGADGRVRAGAARGRGLPDLRPHRQGRPAADRLPLRRCCPRARSTSRPRTCPTSPST